MLFSSLEFLFRFLPIFFIIYYCVGPKYRNIVLMLASLFFYAVGEPIYIFLMMGSIIVNYYLGILIEREQLKEKSGIQWLVISMVFNFSMLFVFKYINFFSGIVNGLVGSTVFKAIELTLPLGISFYTFQITSYIIDVYKKKYPVEKNMVCFGTYVCMFPQLIAGPIVNFAEVREQLNAKRKIRPDKIEYGVEIFILGFAYKVLLANKIGSLWNDAMVAGPMGINTGTAWLASWGYSMQLYFDFFGYSLMAIGLGYMMGFKFPSNFNNPYCSRSVTEFWRRWHITLGRWFREYIYIPLGGNRKGKLRLVLNSFIVWALTGLWHGADWNFIIWGVSIFVVMMFEKLVLKGFTDKHTFVGTIYMLILIPIFWTIFNISDLGQLWTYLQRMFFIGPDKLYAAGAMLKFKSLCKMYWWLLGICAVCATPLPMAIFKRFHKTMALKAVLFVIFWYGVYQLAQGGSNPFLYFRF